MDIPLFINSSDGVRNSNSHDFTITFNPGLHLDKNKKHYIALDSISMSYSWYNIADDYSSNTLKYSHDNGLTWTTITFTNGNYSYNNINKTISNTLLANGHSGSGINVSFEPTLFRLKIAFETGYQLDLRTGSFSEIIGYDKEIVTTTRYDPVFT